MVQSCTELYVVHSRTELYAVVHSRTELYSTELYGVGTVSYRVVRSCT